MDWDPWQLQPGCSGLVPGFLYNFSVYSVYNFDFQTTEEEILISMDLNSFLNTLYSQF